MPIPKFQQESVHEHGKGDRKVAHRTDDPEHPSGHLRRGIGLDQGLEAGGRQDDGRAHQEKQHEVRYQVGGGDSGKADQGQEYPDQGHRREQHERFPAADAEKAKHQRHDHRPGPEGGLDIAHVRRPAAGQMAGDHRYGHFDGAHEEVDHETP